MQPAPNVPWYRSPAFAAFLLVAAGTLAYLNSFAGPFVFDDEPSILHNPTIHRLATAWSPPTGGGLTVSGRPVLNFTLALNYALGGESVGGYHALNLLIHLAGGLTLYGLIRRTLRRPLLASRFGGEADLIALVASALWLLHPLQTAAVTYMVQRAESLCALFYLLTLYAVARRTEPGAGRRWSVVAAIACLLGMGTKEVMVTAPVLAFLYDRTFVAGSFGAVWRARRGLYLTLAGTWILLLVLVLATDGRGETAGFGTAITPLAYGLTQLKAIAHYLQLAVWPAPLVLDYGTPVVTSWTEVLLPALIVIPFAVASVWHGLRGHPAGFCGLAFSLVLAPSSSVVPVATQTMAEHRVYLPLAALAALVAVLTWRWLGRRGLIALAVIAAAFGFLTAQRNRDYASAIGLYEDTLAKAPANARARALLAEYYVRAGRISDGRRALEQAIATQPGVPEMHNNLGNLCLHQGDLEAAVRHFEAALALEPEDPEFTNNLGNALVRAGRLDDGIAYLEVAVKIAPAMPAPAYNLASAYAQAGRTEEAIRLLRRLIERDSGDTSAHNLLGHALSSAGQRTEGIAHLREAVRLAPGNADYHNLLGAALGRAGQVREALAEFEATLRIDPHHASAAKNAALARRRLGGD